MKRNLVVVLIFIGVFKVMSASDSTVNSVMRWVFKWEYSEAVALPWLKADEFQIVTFRFGRHLVVACFNQDGELPGFAKGLFLKELVYENK